MQDFGRIFDGVQNPRTSNATRHNLHEMLTVALPCVLCGGRTCTDMELFGRPEETFPPRFMKPGNGIPGHDAFPGLFRIPGPEGLQRAPVRLAADWAGRLGPEVTAVDGRAPRRSSGDASERSPLHVVNAFATSARLTPGQVRVEGRSNGTTAMPKLLELLDIRGMTVTADAMHRRRDTAKRITEAGGDHLLVLKGNQETLHDDVHIHLADPENAEKVQLFNDVDRGHGRIETREATVCHDVDSLQDLHNRPGLRAVGKVTATRETSGERSTKTRCFLPVGRLGPERFLRTVRPHRAAGNPLHWVLDVTMGEDGLRTRKGNDPDSLATMRRLALNLARKADGGKVTSMRGKLKKAGWDDGFLLKLLGSAAGTAPAVETEKIQTR